MSKKPTQQNLGNKTKKFNRTSVKLADFLDTFVPNNPKRYIIRTDDIHKSFTEHFNTPYNNNILFSGKYGSGKSYFLSEFFNLAETRKNFYTITLSPVNYVVSSNEDIFDLIKVDIIKSLSLDGNLIIKDTINRIPTYQTMVDYLRRKPLQLVKNVSSCLSKVSATAAVVNGISKGVINLLDEFTEFEDEINSKFEASEDKLGKYYLNFVQNQASYLENNVITEMIVTKLADLKLDDERKNVLVIEDLDRLDPAHIFRIFNILSAHQVNESTNKFGFDKVVLVCDLENVERVYRHFYGEETDFYGYINKFYSFEPYHFDNKLAIANHLMYVLNIKLPDAALNILLEIIIIFIKNKVVSLRKVLQLNLKEILPGNDQLSITLSDQFFQVHNRAMNNFTSPYILFNKTDFPVITIVEILACLFDGYDNLDRIFKRHLDYVVSMSFDNQSAIYNLFAATHYFYEIHKNEKFLFYANTENEKNYNIAPKVNFENRSFSIVDVQAAYDGSESFFKNLAYIPEGQMHDSKLLYFYDIVRELKNAAIFFRSRYYI